MQSDIWKYFGPGGSIRQLHQLFDNRIHPKQVDFLQIRLKCLCFSYNMQAQIVWCGFLILRRRKQGRDLAIKNGRCGREMYRKSQKNEEPVTARKTGSSVCGVWSYILESMFVFGFCIRILFKSYLYNKAVKCQCQQKIFKKCCDFCNNFQQGCCLKKSTKKIPFIVKNFNYQHYVKMDDF